MSFAADMDRFSVNLRARTKKVLTVATKATAEVIIEDTPIDREEVDLFGRPREPGNLRRSWNMSLGAAAPGYNSDPVGQMKSALRGMNAETTAYLTNSAVYAPLIEYGVQGAPAMKPPRTWVAKGYPHNIDFQKPTGWVREDAVQFSGFVYDAAEALPK